MSSLSNKQIQSFQEKIWQFYMGNKRHFPWRETFDPYAIVVSEIMLQQTQTDRVLPKYLLFLETFPNFQSLKDASISEVLILWQGLGYNRRALYLKRFAQLLITNYNEDIPNDPQILQKFPGIGKATAGSIITFVYNVPIPFLETNIRRVYINEFFQQEDTVSDIEILEFVKQTIDTKNPREWYYALMDYGSFLGKNGDNPNKRSKHYVKQSKFKGSRRQIRGAIIRHLVSGEKTAQQLIKILQKDGTLVQSILDELKKEGFINKKKEMYFLMQ